MSGTAALARVTSRIFQKRSTEASVLSVRDGPEDTPAKLKKGWQG
jgi:hypothetical protein